MAEDAEGEAEASDSQRLTPTNRPERADVGGNPTVRLQSNQLSAHTTNRGTPGASWASLRG